MKVSKKKMAEHREKILASAAKRFRERGFDGISVAELMQEAGLTHGGFYGHFGSKEELAALASERAMQESIAKWEKVIASAEGDRISALAEYYFAKQRRDRAGSGCFFAALGTDVARQAPPVRAAVGAGLLKYLDLIESVASGPTKKARRQKAIATFSTMIGAMILARSVQDPVLSDEILEAAGASIRLSAPHADQPV